jgi:sugar/nucleoside kinase (ribokinase family)
VTDRAGTHRIVVFGDVIDDIVVVPSGPIRTDTDTPSSISHRAGGSAANVASWLGALAREPGRSRSLDIHFVGRVAASDVDGHEAIFSGYGVTPHLAGDVEHPTGTIVVLVDGNTRSMLTERGANDWFSADDVSDELLPGADLVHFTGYSVYHGQNQDAIGRLLGRASDLGVAVSVDPASAGSIADFGAERFLRMVAGATVLLPNLDEGRVLTGLDDPAAVVERLAQDFPVVAMTMGTAGVVVSRAGGGVAVVEAARAAAVDPTGAGDAFTAGFLSEWVDHADAVAAAEAGVRVAAVAVSAVGARPSH